MLKVYKIDRDYIVLAEDQAIPAVGEKTYSRSAKGALKAHKAFLDEMATDFGRHSINFEIGINEHASAELIEACGLEPVQSLTA